MSIENSQGSKSTDPPRILLTATLRWPIAARLALALSDIGCEVDVVCPRQHPVLKAKRVIRRVFRHRLLNPLGSLHAAVRSASPDLVIPCDDDAAVGLHRLWARSDGTGPSALRLRALIERSLGAPGAYLLATARGQMMTVAATAGLRVPAHATIRSWEELAVWLDAHGYPAVLKRDGTCGGQGVAVVANRLEARAAFVNAVSRPRASNAVARWLFDRDPSALLRVWTSARPSVTVQKFISGTPANRAVACWQGKVLAGTSVEAIRTQHPTGPATVVRVIDNPEMSDAVSRLVDRLGVSGVWGVDFVLESATGAAYLIEVNPRATPISHLPLGAGHDLPAALFAKLTRVPPFARPSKIDRDTIAMFPGEWLRDPDSPWLRSAFLDIPWEEPSLIADGLRRPWIERGLVARLREAVRFGSSESRAKRSSASLTAPINVTGRSLGCRSQQDG